MAHLTNFSFEFVHEIFTEDASLAFLYHSAKSQNDQKLKSRGSCLKNSFIAPLAIGQGAPQAIIRCMSRWSL